MLNDLDTATGHPNPRAFARCLQMVDVTRRGKCAERKHTRGGFHVPQVKKRRGRQACQQRGTARAGRRPGCSQLRLR